MHMAVDTLGHLLAVQVTPANEQERVQIRSLAQEVQHLTVETVKIAFVDQGYTGQEPAQARRKALSCTSSSCKKQRKALSCCRAAGSLSAASDGSIVSDG